jgi:transposase
MEIITGVERRRQWRDEEKLRILAELDQPGVKISEVARRHDISRGLLWQWRDAQRRGRLVAETPAFLPLQVVPELAAPEPPGGSGPPPCADRPDPDARIEIVLPDGTAVRVTATISAAALRRVLAALRA